MYREIKFRGKELETGQWIYGKLIENKNKGEGYHYIAPFDIIPYAENNKQTIKEGGYPDYDEKDYSHCWKEREAIIISIIKVDSKTIGQYTGLHDKNGKEIYEGDIIQHWYEYSDITDRYLVDYDEDELRYVFQNLSNRNNFIALEDLYDEDYGNYAIEVIGNIYDNPELLEV